jgi:two-component system cell cycle sensor histidine kinase/response regulator CckA
MRWDTMTPPESHGSDQRAVDQLRKTGVAAPWEKEFFCKDGSRVSVLIGVATLAGRAGGLECVSFVVDISERKQLEIQLRQAHKMEAIGRLAGGVSHDFNNLLAVILGYSDLVLDALPPDHPAVKKVEMIRKAGASAADLTRQLLAFSRQQMLQPRVLNVRDIVERTQELLSRLIGEDIQFSTSLEPSLGCVRADPGQIEQVLVNLIVNARDAMPQGGRLTIEARNVVLDDSYVDAHEPVIPGPYVMLAVEDAGCGMDQKTQSRIFDPFFTTKALGKGTGLGLATVYGIVKQSGGYIWVYSELGEGTVFKVYLPRVEQDAQETEPSDPVQLITQNCETILLAEDSASLREMAREYLSSVGYTILEAASGEEALQKARDFDGTIHLLLTDVVMPGMSGPDLARQMVSLRPRIKLIFVSGYTGDAIARQGVLDPSVAFIQKPYRPKALARKIREVLGVPGATIGDPIPSHSG